MRASAIRRRRVARALAALALAALAVVVACGCAGTGDEVQEGAGEAEAEGPYATGTHHARITVAGYGTIEVELYADEAPATVANFCELAESGFYDGLTFHRVVPGFVIQGGDPAGDGTGGSDHTVRGEFEANGVDNGIAHGRGTISMARSSDYDSASSQFFIVQEAAPSLNGQYAAFGRVTSGMEVVDAICERTPVADESTGYVAPEDQPVIESVEVLD